MQVPRFSPRISLIEMAPRPAPAAAALPYPAPALPCLSPQTDRHRERAVIGRIFQALPTQTDTTTVAFIYRIAMWLFITIVIVFIFSTDGIIVF
jgi:hypothetical protein